MKWLIFVVGVLMGCAVCAQDLMELSEAQVMALIPGQTPVAVADPASKMYLSAVGKDWGWKPTQPDQIVSPLDGTVYPNSTFPMDKRARFLNYLGEEVVLPYYEGAKVTGDLGGNPHPERYFFNGAIDHQKFTYLRAQLPRLVERYLESGDQQIARRIGIVLDGVAIRYKHYLLSDGRGVNNYYISTGGPCLSDGRPVGEVGMDHPYPWTAGRFYGPWTEEIQPVFIDAYAAIKDSPALPQLSQECGVNVAQRIENQLIREMVDFVMEIPWKYQMGNNLVGYFAQVAKAGKVIGEAEYVHIAYRFLNEVFLKYGKESPDGVGYTFDLHHPGGAQAHYGMMRDIYHIYKSMEGYSDPPNYRGKKDGKHLANISLARDLPLFERMIYVPETYAVPNGGAGPLRGSRSRLLPGWGHAVLGDGEGDQQVQVQLQFSEQSANSSHKDCLSIVWYAHGKELSGDIGDQQGPLRQWSAHALSHNTVVVDRKDQDAGDTFGNIEYYEPNLPGLAAIKVNSPGAYRSLGVETYQRTIILNTIDISRPYFVDFFDVAGGTVHDFSIHGAIDGLMKGASDLALEPMSAKRPLLVAGETGEDAERLAVSHFYGLFSKVSRALVEHPFYVDFRGSDNEPATRMHVVPDHAMEFFLGETPAYDGSMPHAILRNKTGNSAFTTVYDMHRGQPAIKTVAWVSETQLQITLQDRVDVYSFDARRSGFHLEVNQPTKETVRYAVNQSKLFGTILGGSRKLGGYKTDSLITETVLPLADELQGNWVIVRHPGVDVSHAYEIRRVSQQGGFFEIELMSDSGLNIGSAETEEVFSPWRTFSGDNSFVIHRSSCSIKRPAILPNTGPWDRLQPQQFVPFMDEIQVEIKGDGIVGYTAGGDQVAVYTAPFTLKKSATIKAVIAVPNAGMALPRIEQRFVGALDANAVENAQPGLRGVYLNSEKTPQSQIVPNFVPQSVGLNTFEGVVEIETAGIYTFYLQARHDATLKVGDLELIDTTGLGPYRTWSVKVPLREGAHPVSVTYNQAKGPFDPELNLSYAPPGEKQLPIPDHALFHRP